jgi:hypothetical protein
MPAAHRTAAPAASPSAIHNQPPGRVVWTRRVGPREQRHRPRRPSRQLKIPESWRVWRCFRRSSPRSDRGLCGQTDLDAKALYRLSSRTGFVLSTLTYRDAVWAGGCRRVCVPSIKGRCMDQGRMHVEKRSNRVRLSLIGGEAGGAGSADSDHGKVPRGGGFGRTRMPSGPGRRLARFARAILSRGSAPGASTSTRARGARPVCLAPAV